MVNNRHYGGIMEIDKWVKAFLNRKAVKVELGADYQLSDMQRIRLIRLMEEYGKPRDFEDMLGTVAKFIKYDLTNYLGRYRRLKGVSGTSVYTQMLRYGRGYKDIYIQQGDRKTRHFESRTSVWIDRGYTEMEANEKVREVQTKNSILSARKTRGTSQYTVRSVEYWLNNGYTVDEATEKVRKVQTTNGLEYYKSRYPDDYEERYQDRIDRWLASFNDNNMELINAKKSHSVEGAMSRGHSLEEAIEIRRRNVEHMRTIRKLPSKISQRLFDGIQCALGDEQCYYDDRNYEFLVSGYRVDFFHPESGTVVEFYGDFYHRNPMTYSPDYVAHGITSSEKWEYDKTRELDIKKSPKVRELIVIWESEYRKAPTTVLHKIMESINARRYGN